MLYHVAHADRAPEIRERGLRSGDLGRHSSQKQAIHRRMDEIGTKSYKRWVKRTSAVFAWTTFERAKQYASNFEDPIIVEIEAEGTVWMAPESAVNGLYKGDVPDEEALADVIRQSTVWRDEVRNDIEVWLRPADARVESLYSLDGSRLSEMEVEA